MSINLPVSAVIIRNIRLQVGIQQREMSELFGFGINQICNWENGKSRIRFEDLIMIIEEYNLDISNELKKARNMKSLDKVQSLLVRWGEFWYYKEQGQGYGSNSVTGRLCETLRTGIWSTGTANQVSDKAESIYVPDWAGEVDDAIEDLTDQERKWLNVKYKRAYKNDKERESRKKFTNLFIARGENKLCGLL